MMTCSKEQHSRSNLALLNQQDMSSNMSYCSRNTWIDEDELPLKRLIGCLSGTIPGKKQIQ